MARDGTKTGGRVKGTKNKKRPADEIVINAGESPLEFMLRMMRDEEVDNNLRMDMAKAAAPYIHAKFAPKSDNTDNKEKLDYDAIGKALAGEMDKADSSP